MSSSVTIEQQKQQHDSSETTITTSHHEPKAMSRPQTSASSCIQLKGSLIPMTVLELSYFELEQFKMDLNAKISQAPDFFENLPIIIDLEKFDEQGHLAVDDIINCCKDFSIKVVAVRGGSELLQTAAKDAGLSILAKQKERTNKTNEAASTVLPEQTPTVNTQIETVEVEVIKTKIEKQRQISKIIHHPIRSGQQVYASDGDLIIMASVSAGAEILADGNVHVYGTLRGRALAGVKGDTSARIFCHKLEAELVSVAGQYKVSEDISKAFAGKPAQVYLDGNTLHFKEIEQ